MMAPPMMAGSTSGRVMRKMVRSAAGAEDVRRFLHFGRNEIERGGVKTKM